MVEKLQAIFRRKLTARKLEKLIPEIIGIYYSPGCKGEFLAEQAFSSRLRCVEKSKK
jgi:hypothetical protein